MTTGAWEIIANATQGDSAWCSWCGEYTFHRLVKKNLVERNEYQCTSPSCGHYTIMCRAPQCQNMAKHKPQEIKAEGIAKFAESWASEFCAEHDGSVADFSKLSMKLGEITDYTKILERHCIDYSKVGKIGGCILLGGAVLGPFAWLAAPGVAAALGSLGILGAAGTGTAISTLSGAALVSASLAAIGPGGVAGGVACLVAAGAALGGTVGGMISNAYIGEIDNFSIKKVRLGNKGPAVIFINGFLNEDEGDFTEWLNPLFVHFQSNPCYGITWESGSLKKLGAMCLSAGGTQSLRLLAQKIAEQGGKETAKKLAPLAWVLLAKDIINNPWHTTLNKAQMVGAVLADILRRTSSEEGFILMGHSLGAKVIFHALSVLGASNISIVRDVYLFGGAVCNKPEEWAEAKKAFSGTLHNFYSTNDKVLGMLYESAKLFTSKAAGYDKLLPDCDKVKNIDVTHEVKGHMKYKSALGTIFSKINT